MHPLINKDKWWDILSRFIDVLRMNIYMVDCEGQMLLPPEQAKYGGRFIIDPSFGYEISQHAKGLISHFYPQGKFLEFEGRYGLSSFAIPVQWEANQTAAYLIAGPVILSRRLSNHEYEEIAGECGANPKEVLNQLAEVRVVSNLMINSILDLLAEIVKDTVELGKRSKDRGPYKNRIEEFPQELEKVADEIYSTIRLDELLASLLDVALKMTNAECGSIMVLDKEKRVLNVKVSRGLDLQKINPSGQKVDEGVAGIVVEKKTPYIIEGQSADQAMKPFLKRKEIARSVLLPLEGKSQIFGVLNIHTKSPHNRIQDSLDNLQHLSRLISSVI